MGHDELIAILRLRLAQIDQSAADVSRRATGEKQALLRIFRGHEPSYRRLADICAALDLEFYIGPPRPPEPVKISDYSAPIIRKFGAMDPALEGLLGALAAAWPHLAPADQAQIKATLEIFMDGLSARAGRRAKNQGGGK